jgi:hypothetical protein
MKKCLEKLAAAYDSMAAGEEQAGNANRAEKLKEKAETLRKRLTKN